MTLVSTVHLWPGATVSTRFPGIFPGQDETNHPAALLTLPRMFLHVSNIPDCSTPCSQLSVLPKLPQGRRHRQQTSSEAQVPGEGSTWTQKLAGISLKSRLFLKGPKPCFTWTIFSDQFRDFPPFHISIGTWLPPQSPSCSGLATDPMTQHVHLTQFTCELSSFCECWASVTRFHYCSTLRRSSLHPIPLCPSFINFSSSSFQPLTPGVLIVLDSAFSRSFPQHLCDTSQKPKSEMLPSTSSSIFQWTVAYLSTHSLSILIASNLGQ